LIEKERAMNLIFHLLHVIIKIITGDILVEMPAETTHMVVSVWTKKGNL